MSDENVEWEYGIAFITDITEDGSITEPHRWGMTLERAEEFAYCEGNEDFSRCFKVIKRPLGPWRLLDS